MPYGLLRVMGAYPLLSLVAGLGVAIVKVATDLTGASYFSNFDFPGIES